MTNTLETNDTVAAQSALRSNAPTDGRGKLESAANVVCDLAQARTFSAHIGVNVPVSVAFGADRLHAYKLDGDWDLEKAASENGDALFRSVRRLAAQNAAAEWDDLTFQFGPQEFLYADDRRVVGFASTPGGAERLARKFGQAYPLAPKPDGGNFYLIQSDGDCIKAHEVCLTAETILPPDSLDLHYGNGSEEWHRDFVGKLRSQEHGLSIFEGRPGTGKTFYLRHLMGVLKESHRFYFIPTLNMGVLSRPEFIGFWTEQHRSHGKRRFVVILEDSDAALMTRGADNREQVSAILNLSDGMLADFLHLQIICTINCSAADVDPALLRPGRLLCHRVFNRLDYAQAARLAESLGKKLPVAGDYSLAEIFAGNGVNEINRPRIGFAA